MSIRDTIVALGLRLGVLHTTEADVLLNKRNADYDDHDPTGFKEDIYLLHKAMIDEFLEEQRKKNANL